MPDQAEAIGTNSLGKLHNIVAHCLERIVGCSRGKTVSALIQSEDPEPRTKRERNHIPTR